MSDRGYVVDFLCLERRVVIEIDGGQHSGSHYDGRRSHDLEAMDMIVIHFWIDDVLLRTEAVLEDILRTLEAPHPLPLPVHGERERIARHRAHRRARHRP